MTISNEFWLNFKEKYEKTECLVAENSKLDPPSEPYKSHYQARNILLELSQTIKQQIEQTNDNETAGYLFTLQFVLAQINVDLGKVYNFIEETATGEKFLNEALDSLKGHQTSPKAICIVLSGLNESGIMWMNRGESEKAKNYLIDAETNYNIFRKGKSEPSSIYDIFDNSLNSEHGRGEKLLEKLNILTLFYLAQVYGSLGDLEKSATYCHTTLKKQLLLDEFEPFDWAINAATLSQYFCTNNRYTEARHHLAAATQILLEHQKDMVKADMSDDEKNTVEENLNHRLADVDRCWIKYALHLMLESRDRLLGDNDENDIDHSKESDLLLFGAKIDVAYENIITDRYLLDMDDVKPVFLNAIKWVEKAKAYYTADLEATEYSKIVQDQALTYKHLAFFESDPSNQAKLHKRRIHLLEDLLKLLNKVFYMNIVREVLYELGTAYTNILDIKLEAFELNQKSENSILDPNALEKINELITKSRNNFIEFISTYRMANSLELMPNISTEEMIPISFSHFQIARISYKFITPDKQLQYKNLSICLENYKMFVALCAANGEIEEKMKAEVGVSKEMIQLLSLKLERHYRNQINS